MKITGALIATAATVASAGAFGISSAPTASADEAAGVSNQGVGSSANIVNGSSVQAWTVSNLKQSADTIPYQVHGTLWEAAATDEAVQGGITPIVSNLNATSPSGQTYRALYQVGTPQGINPATLVQGQKTSGKVYFDVTGDNPNSVVYRDAGGQDLASWSQSTTSQRGTGRQAAPAGTGGQAAPTPAGKPAAPAGNPATPPAGRQGTPIPAGGQGTPSPAGSAASPAGNPAAPAPAAGSPETSSGSPEAPAPAGNPAAQAPSSGQPAATGNGTSAPGGGQVASQGTPTP